MRRRGDTVRSARSVSVLVAGAVLVAACTGGGDSDPPATVVTTTTVPPLPRIDDGILRIGALIPAADTVVGPMLATSIENAVAAVNEAGGVLGNDVELLTEDEGSSPISAAQAIEKLAARGVDAIVGPTSSNTAIGALDEAVADGIVTCSATASAIALDAFPDDNLFFRTIAPDSLQATAIAAQAESIGASNVAIIHTDDAYGRPYAEHVEDALSSSTVVETVSVPVDDGDLTGDLDELLDANPQVVVVLGSGEDTAKFLEALGGRDDVTAASIIVNDAARPAARPVIADMPASIRNRIVMLVPQIVLPESAGVTDNPPFGPQATDCVNLLALAAIQGDSDAPVVIAGQMPSVSDGGARCRTFAICVDRLADGQQINYDGPTGITELARDGDPSRAFFDLFRFAADGSEVFDGPVAVRA